MTGGEPWSERAELYRTSAAHSQGPDLDQEVVSCDPAPGMRPDVICFAEELPFADSSFELGATRVAAHHFADVARATRELGRVASERVVVVDTMFMGEDVERAEVLRDPSHVRNYAEEEWRSFFGGAGIEVEEVRFFATPIDFEEWLIRTDCTGETAEEVRTLLAGRVGGGMLTLDRIALRGIPR